MRPYCTQTIFIQMIAYLVWAGTGATTGTLLLYESLFHEDISSNIKLIWGIASGTMLLISGIILYFFLVAQAQAALLDISGRHGSVTQSQ